MTPETFHDIPMTVVPNLLLDINHYLEPDDRVSTTEMVVLLNIITAWKDDKRWPALAKSTIAKRMGLSTRQVQRAITALENKELISRIERRSSNKAINFGRLANGYDLSKLVELLSMIAAEPEAQVGNAEPKYYGSMTLYKHEQRQNILRLHSEGVSVKEIAQRSGLSRERIYQFLREAGIRRKPKAPEPQRLLPDFPEHFSTATLLLSEFYRGVLPLHAREPNYLRQVLGLARLSYRQRVWLNRIIHRAKQLGLAVEYNYQSGERSN